MSNWLKIAISLTLGVCVACGGTQPKEELRTIRHDELNIDGHARLPEGVTPTYYELDLSIDPSKDTFSGSVRISVNVEEATSVIYMHADKLEISNAAITSNSADGKMYQTSVVPGANGGMGLTTRQELMPGEYVITMEYTGELDEVPTSLYRVKDGDSWYAYTQFEPLEARAAFPSFDEPRFKTPYRTTLRVPEGQLALTNGPEKSRKVEDGTAIFQYEETKPLPTYLVAFAVGEFDVVEAAPDAIPGVPFRIITTKGKGKLADYMLKQTPIINAELLDYFGGTFPYAKLDVVAVPNFAAGAMENVGLVTFRESLLLIDPETASASDKRSALSVMAHELAHMWFGNLVTLPWWDDLWLNESFATWMASKMLFKVAPELESNLDRIGGASRIMSQDANKEARAIRQPIESGGDVYNAFDGITYGKGANVLRMLEAWIGEDAMKAAIRSYLDKNAHSTGTTEDLIAAFAEASGKPVPDMLETFLDQPGTPLLDMKLTCDDKPKVTVEQSRYLPAGSTASQGVPWLVPACIRYQVGSKSEVHCELVTEETKAIELPAKRCPKWIYPNANESGYYRWTLPGDQISNLVAKHRNKLTIGERVGLFGNVRALAEAQKIEAVQYLDALEELGEEKHRVIVEEVIDAFYPIEEIVPEDKAARKAFEKKMSRLIRRHMKGVSFRAKKDENPRASLLRPRLIWASAKLADDDKTIKKAQKATSDFLSKMDSIDSSLARVALPIAAWDGGADLWLSYKMAVQQAPTPAARRAVLTGLGNFKDPALQKQSLALLLDGTIRSQDYWSVFGPMTDDDTTREVAWTWFTENYDKIVEKLGEKSAPRLPWVAASFCSEEGKKKAEEFFAPDERRPLGADRNLANALEYVDRCIQKRNYLKPAVNEWLQ